MEISWEYAKTPGWIIITSPWDRRRYHIWCVMYDPGISFYQNFPADVFCTTKPIGVCQKGNDLVDVWFQPTKCFSMVICCNWFGSVFNGNLLQLQIENTVFNGNLLQLLMCSCFPIDLLPSKKFGSPWPLLSLTSGDGWFFVATARVTDGPGKVGWTYAERHGNTMKNHLHSSNSTDMSLIW